MSIINLGLQAKLSDELEEEINNCNNLQLQTALASDPSKVGETIAPRIELLQDIMK